jgi:hypothetical protein
MDEPLSRVTHLAKQVGFFFGRIPRDRIIPNFEEFLGQIC